MDKKQTGNMGEDFAARQLENGGMAILARNYHSRWGEVDIIAADGESIAFVEVKTRTEDALVDPFSAVTPAKQKKLCRTAVAYLMAHPQNLQPRFDVFAITVKKGDPFEVLSFQHIINAFEVDSYESI
ncbi:MAG: YraN family protein [Oscillospiraceae bacterium]|nr:YraN family protein [Oscillospiraceae bacterium]